MTRDCFDRFVLCLGQARPTSDYDRFTRRLKALVRRNLPDKGYIVANSVSSGHQMDLSAIKAEFGGLLAFIGDITHARRGSRRNVYVSNLATLLICSLSAKMMTFVTTCSTYNGLYFR